MPHSLYAEISPRNGALRQRRILLTGLGDRRRYEQALTEQGHTVLSLRLRSSEFDDEIGRIAELVKNVDAVVIPGGADLDPAQYGSVRHVKTGRIDSPRDRFEIATVKQAVERQIPLLGICRGHQILAVAAGASLHQHLPDIPGREPHAAGDQDVLHDVELVPGSFLETVFNGIAANHTISVNSHHHQAVDESTIPPDWRVSAWASDGTVEAIEALSEHVQAIGVQWHPERLWRDSSDGALQESATTLMSFSWAKSPQ